MRKLITQKVSLIMSMFFLMAILVTAFSAPALAQGDELQNFGLNYANNIGLQNANPKTVVVNIIQVALSFLAIVAVIIIIVGGFIWMTAGGSDEKVTTGRKFIVNGAIGLIIILAAYGITNWLIDTIQNNIVNDSF